MTISAKSVMSAARDSSIKTHIDKIDNILFYNILDMYLIIKGSLLRSPLRQTTMLSFRLLEI